MLMEVNSTAGTAGGPAGSLPKITPGAIKWAEGRKLSAETLALLGVGSGTAFFPDAGTKLDAMFFKYPDGWKARAYPEKHFVAGKGFKLSFWNIDRVLAANPERSLCHRGRARCVRARGGGNTA
jgi:twinkle protein